LGAGNPPACAQTCPGPQAGQSTCRPGYVCAAFGPSSSTGICRPSCLSFGCQVGVCNPDGYCR
jgi:hypothetical protein